MKFNYQFCNLMGCAYRQGNLVFTSDGSCVISPVGNRITVFDLIHHKSQTLPFQQGHDIRCIALSPNDKLLASIDNSGMCVLINFQKRITLGSIKFRSDRIRSVTFSPNSEYMAVVHDNWVSVWKSPSLAVQWKPMVLHRRYTNIHYDEILTLNWSPDSQFFVTGGRDRTARINALHPTIPFRSQTLRGHKGYIIAAFFGSDFKLYTLTHEGFIYKWICGASEDLHYKYSIESPNPESKKLPLLMYSSYTSYGKHLVLVRNKANYVITCAAFHQSVQWKPNDNVNKIDTNQSDLKTEGYEKNIPSNTFINDLLCIGKSNGVMNLYSMPSFELIHAITISRPNSHTHVSRSLTTCTISPTGDWIAFGNQKLGQLSVWEWKSETFVLKQQGHYFNCNCLAFSNDGQLIATGGADGKLKLWNTINGFCFITFQDHTAPITKICFATNNSSIVVSASLDGTVRVYDLVRYVNFRTLKPPTRETLLKMDNLKLSEKDQKNIDESVAIPQLSVRFISLAIDPTAEIICAGCEDPFDIYVWSMRTGKVLDILSGHEGPVSCLSFSRQNQLASGSWDKTVRLWDIYNHKASTEVINTLSNSEILDMCHSPIGNIICVCTLSGHLEFYDCIDGTILHTMDIRKDCMGGRKTTEMFGANKNSQINHYTTISYSPDGMCLLAGGKGTKYIGLYYLGGGHAKLSSSNPNQTININGLLLSRYMTTSNRDLEGVIENVNWSKALKEGQRQHGLDMSTVNSLFSEYEQEKNRDMIKLRRNRLPGVEITEQSTRFERLVAGTNAVAFSPNGMYWCAVTTDGILLYSNGTYENNVRMAFDPIDLDVTITPQSILQILKNNLTEKNSQKNKESYLKVLLMALRLNQWDLIVCVMTSIPSEYIPLTLQYLPVKYLEKLLTVCAVEIVKSQYLQFYLEWIHHTFIIHGHHIQTHSTNHYMPTLRLLQKNVSYYYKHLKPICEGNNNRLDFLASFASDTLNGGTSRKKLAIDIQPVKRTAIVPTGKFEPVPFEPLKDNDVRRT